MPPDWLWTIFSGGYKHMGTEITLGNTHLHKKGVVKGDGECSSTERRAMLPPPSTACVRSLIALLVGCNFWADDFDGVKAGKHHDPPCGGRKPGTRWHVLHAAAGFAKKLKAWLVGVTGAVWGLR